MICPICNSPNTKKNGTKLLVTGNRTQEFHCQGCGKYFSFQIDVGEQHRLNSVEPGDILVVEGGNGIRVHGLTDVHVGAVEHDFKKLQDAIDIIEKDDNARWFGNGDLLELIPPHYKINQRGQDIPPEEQYLEFARLVAPIKDKCLFIRGGNHDYIRSFNILDFDVCKVLAKELSVPYYRMPGYTKIKVGKSCYNLVSGHGKSGGANGDMELNKMAAVYSEGDVFFLGHNHQLYVKPMDSLIIGKDGTEEIKRRWYIRGGSFLRYADYARYSFFPIIRTGWVTIEFKEEGIRCWEN
jgi:predicted phosphodiesterase|tara:strand:- start:900 stop:1787 length:888 start_codon:yes stop_codon:yes gene_type:complete